MEADSFLPEPQYKTTAQAGPLVCLNLWLTQIKRELMEIVLTTEFVEIC
jgi:hypothetical protein